MCMLLASFVVSLAGGLSASNDDVTRHDDHQMIVFTVRDGGWSLFLEIHAEIWMMMVNWVMNGLICGQTSGMLLTLMIIFGEDDEEVGKKGWWSLV